MKTRRSIWPCVTLLATFTFLLQASMAARAQDQDQAQVQTQNQNQDQNDQDPPGRVARLSYSQGSVSFRPAGEDDWVTAVPNRPLVTGDDLWADENSRVEANVGSAAIRLGSKTGVTFLALDDHTTQIRLAQGSLIMRVRHVDDDDTYEVDTPNLAFSLLQPGEYRIDVSADGNQTITTVWHGRGRVTGGGFSYNVVAHQTATFTGSDRLDYDVGQVPQDDDLDRWAFDRDDREDRSDSANYVSREMTGYEDLDEYGDWSYVAGYGPCWRPRAVVVGWAPYRFGHWAWIAPWGWTWVEDEPWGFAPFHYGRWAFVGAGWFWVPGPVVVRPVWAPALVAFVGAGRGVGWFPLGPGEVFVPGYRVSRAYVNNVNITNTSVNVTKITNVYNTVVINKSTTVNHITYVNQRVNGGVTVVSREAFVSAKPVANNVMRVDPKELQSASTSHLAPVEPTRSSVIGAGRAAPVRPPTAAMSRQVVAQRTPPPPPRSFQQKVAEAGGHLNQQPLVRPEPQPSRNVQANEAGRTQPTQEGFRPFGQPNSGNNQGWQQPRTWEQQGSPQTENRGTQAGSENKAAQPDNRNAPPENQERTFQPPQREEGGVTKQSHPLVRPAPPVDEQNAQHEQQQEQKFRAWQQQRPASPPPQRQPSRSSEPRQERPSKPKGH
jgi:uncharacterized protein DUF6600